MYIDISGCWCEGGWIALNMRCWEQWVQMTRDSACFGVCGGSCVARTVSRDRRVFNPHVRKKCALGNRLSSTSLSFFAIMELEEWARGRACQLLHNTSRLNVTSNARASGTLHARLRAACWLCGFLTIWRKSLCFSLSPALWGDEVVAGQVARAFWEMLCFPSTFSGDDAVDVWGKAKSGRCLSLSLSLWRSWVLGCDATQTERCVLNFLRVSGAGPVWLARFRALDAS